MRCNLVLKPAAQVPLRHPASRRHVGRTQVVTKAFDDPEKKPGKIWFTAADEAARQALPKVTLEINGRQVDVPEGSTIMQAAHDVDVYIPHLCHHPRLEDNAPGSCRLCQVEVDGKAKPACKTEVTAGMKIDTDTEAIRAGVTKQLNALLGCHPDDCMTCLADGKCDFQDLIRKYHVTDDHNRTLKAVDEKGYDALGPVKDQSSPALQLDFDRCVKCGRCSYVCNDVQMMNVLQHVGKGKDRRIGIAAGVDLDSTNCIECGQCAAVCPTGAIFEREEWQDVERHLENRRGGKVVVVQTAPATRVAIGEEVGLEAGSISTGRMVAALRKLGFDYVFDTNFTADLTIMEEGMELIKRLTAVLAEEKEAGSIDHPLPAAGTDGHPAAEGDHENHMGPVPMFTSCCPAWVNFVEKEHPELIPHLSTCKSPQQMMGAVIKRVWAERAGVKPEDVISVSVMPCTAKKHEAERPGMGEAGVADVDYVITTRELGRMLREKRVPLGSLKEEEYDDPLGSGTGAAVIFGATGGVMEAAVRTAYEVVTGEPLADVNLTPTRGFEGVKEATLHMKSKDGAVDRDVRIAIANNIGNARNLVDAMERGEVHYDFVEVMACSGGCIGGGGQPKTADPMAAFKRMMGIYEIDERSTPRKSHENPDVVQIYKEVFGEPNSHKAHELLHTTYTDRSATTVKADPPAAPKVRAKKAAPKAAPPS
ncbi:unnamed protein product [Pedinophyceae sp. YPF-701]|nr:unnamed protein product [Pedinophyceae sp. YPF-701]